MKSPKRILILSTTERRQILHFLIDFRNKLITQGRYPDTADELLLKIQKAKKYRKRYHH